MKLIPVLTEKSMRLTKEHGFTFWVPVFLTKLEIKNLIEKTFDVHVVSVRTINFKASTKRNIRGKVQKIKAAKKAMVFVEEGEKISVFEEEKKVRKNVKKTKKDTK